MRIKFYRTGPFLNIWAVQIDNKHYHLGRHNFAYSNGPVFKIRQEVEEIDIPENLRASLDKAIKAHPDRVLEEAGGE